MKGKRKDCKAQENRDGIGSEGEENNFKKNSFKHEK
jgi:hypothetical protein